MCSQFRGTQSVVVAELDAAGYSVAAVRKQRGEFWCQSPFSFSLGPQPMAWYCPHAECLFLPPSNPSESALPEALRGVLTPWGLYLRSC